MGAFDAIELALLSQRIHPRPVALVEIPVWMGDGNLDPFRLQDRQDLFNRWIGRARYLIAHAGFQLSVLLGAGNESVIDTIVGQHSCVLPCSAIT